MPTFCRLISAKFAKHLKLHEVANISNIYIICSVEEPKLNLSQVNKFLISAEQLGVEVSLVLTKCDLITEEKRLFLIEKFHQWGYQAITLNLNNPENLTAGKRDLPFSKELFIEKNDFMEDPPNKFFRLGPGREVRFRFAYFITCQEVIKNDAGEIVELHCTYDPETRGGNAPDGRKVKGTIHWVSAAKAFETKVRLYDRLFTTEDPNKEEDGKTFLDYINESSLEVIADAKLEPSLSEATPGESFQFERLGYFCADLKDSENGKPVFNRTTTLRDTWSKQKNKS